MPLPVSLEDDCAEGPPVGLAVLNGTADPLVPYDGGQITLLGKERGGTLSTDRTMRVNWPGRSSPRSRKTMAFLYKRAATIRTFSTA